MINEPPPLKDLNIRIPIIFPIKGRPFKDLNIRIPVIFPLKGRGFINHGSGLGLLPMTLWRTLRLLSRWVC